MTSLRQTPFHIHDRGGTRLSSSFSLASNGLRKAKGNYVNFNSTRFSDNENTHSSNLDVGIGIIIGAVSNERFFLFRRLTNNVVSTTSTLLQRFLKLTLGATTIAPHNSTNFLVDIVTSSSFSLFSSSCRNAKLDLNISPTITIRNKSQLTLSLLESVSLFKTISYRED